jgi:hypothetical protein
LHRGHLTRTPPHEHEKTAAARGDPMMGYRIASYGQSKINRRDFGMTFDMLLDGNVIVSYAVQLLVDFQASIRFVSNSSSAKTLREGGDESVLDEQAGDRFDGS